jgi:hypothetical protein
MIVATIIEGASARDFGGSQPGTGGCSPCGKCSSEREVSGESMAAVVLHDE